MARLNPLEAATTREVADAFGLKTESVHAWREEAPEGADGLWWWSSKKGNGQIRWNLPKVIEWRMKRAADAAGAKQVAPAAKPMTDLDREQLRKVKRENDEREGLLVDRAELERQWAKVGAALRQRLEAIGRRHGQAVANDLSKGLAEVKRSVHGLLGGPK